jgi:hypothetical protein
MTHQNRSVLCRPKRSATPLLVASTATTTIIAGGWKEFAHLVDTHALYPNLSWSCKSRIEESFPTAANGCNTANRQKERSLNV